MNAEQHERYIERIKAIQDKLDSLKPDDLELTDDEEGALDNVDKKYIDLMNKIRASYISQYPEYDYVELAARKAVALYALEMIPFLEAAYALGESTV